MSVLFLTYVQFKGRGANVRYSSLPRIEASNFSLLPTLGPAPSPVQCVVGYFSGVKRPERELDRSHPSSAEFKSEWSYTTSPFLCLRCRRVRIIAKSAYHIVMSVRLPAPTSAVPTGQIFLKFDIENFYENLL
jgi:hypothetical protein